MYVQCTVNLCISTLPSHKCPNLCSDSFSPRVLEGNLFTKTYTVVSAPISLLDSAFADSPPEVPAAAGTSAPISAEPTSANGKILWVFFLLP